MVAPQGAQGLRILAGVSAREMKTAGQTASPFVASLFDDRQDKDSRFEKKVGMRFGTLQI